MTAIRTGAATFTASASCCSKCWRASCPMWAILSAEIFAGHRSAAVPRLPARAGRYQPIIDRLLAKGSERSICHGGFSFSMI